MYRNPLCRVMYSGKAPLYYLVDVVKLDMRPYAIALRVSWSLWDQIEPILQKPHAYLKGWDSGYMRDWVGPNLKGHARWGLSGWIVSMRENRNRQRQYVEFRIPLPQGSAGFPDLREVYINLDVFFRVLYRANWGKQSVPPAIDMYADAREATQLIAVESMLEGALKIGISPVLSNYLATTKDFHPQYSPTRYVQEMMDGVWKHLGAEKVVLLGDVKPTVAISKQGLFFFRAAKIGCMPKQELSTLVAPHQQGYTLVSTDRRDFQYSDGTNSIFVVNITFLCGLIELVNQITTRGRIYYQKQPS